MKKFLLLFLLAIGFPIEGNAQTPQTAVGGFGTIAATTASALVSSMTLGVNSPAWNANGLQRVYIMNIAGSAGILYVCPLGGTCSATVGIPIQVGAWYGFYQPSPNMTIIAASTATVWVQW